MLPEHLKTEFRFGSSRVQIISGDPLSIAGEENVDALVVIADNYLTMTSGLTARIHEILGEGYARSTQETSPVRVGSVVVTGVMAGASSGKRSHSQPDEVLPRFIFHSAVVDYDFSGIPLETLVSTSCRNALDKADDLGLGAIAFEVIGLDERTIAMSLSARSLCSEIKNYLAEERIIKDIVLILQDPVGSSAGLGMETARFSEKFTDFVREANAILASPYDPQTRVRQARDFFGRSQEFDFISELLHDQIQGKRHLAVFGGPGIGKWMLLDQLYFRSQSRGFYSNLPGSDSWRFARVSFSAEFPEGDETFLFRKLLIALIRHEGDGKRRSLLRKVYASEKLDAVTFLDTCSQMYGEAESVVFLCDGFPLNPGTSDISTDGAFQPHLVSFLRAVEAIQHRVHFLFTAEDEPEFGRRKALAINGAPGFCDGLAYLQVRVITEQERTAWINGIYQRYLFTDGEAPLEMHRFIDEVAGYHPYAISLGCSLMLSRMKRVALNTPQVLTDGWNRAVLRAIAEYARKMVEQPLRDFFDHMLSSLPHQAEVDLYNLSRAVIAEDQVLVLGPALAIGDPNAQARMVEILQQGDPRDLLHEEGIRWLVDNGFVLKDQGGKEKPSIPSMANYVIEKLGGYKRPEDRPTDVTISLLHHLHPARGKRSEKSTVTTLFNTRGGRIAGTEKQFAQDLRKDFLESFNQFLDNRRDTSTSKEKAINVFNNVEEVANFLLSQYASTMVKRYLEQPPPGCTINFLVDEALTDIPWELMLEAVYAGEIPFRVGRSIITHQPPGFINPPVRGPGAVKALLIGNPTDDLQAAVYEVEWLQSALENSPYFGEVEVLVGSEACQRIKVLNSLSSGKFGLVHYSGHSRYSGEGSAWGMSDGVLTTSILTSAIQSAPPAMVFSSSCFSGTGGGVEPVEYENQAFDLPGAFLGAGVDVYIGTLWEVEEDATRRLVERFYSSLLVGDVSLGECLRRARQSLKLEQERRDRIDWLAFILYGDPRLIPVDLYPVFRGK